MNKEDLHILVIPEYFERWSQNIKTTFAPELTDKYDIQLHCIDPLPPTFDEVLEESRKIIKEYDVRVLLISEDSAALAAGILKKEFPHLRTPSIETVFLCHHKYYTHKCVDTSKNPIKFTVVNCQTANTNKEVSRIKEEIGLPCIVKPCLGSTSYGLYKCLTEQDLSEALDKMIAGQAQDLISPILSMVEEHIDHEKYPLASAPAVIVQEFIDQFKPEGPRAKIYETELFVTNGNIITFPPLGVVYLPYGEDRPTSQFPGLQFPPPTTEKNLQSLYNAMESDARRLIELGFNDGCLHGEYFLFDDGEVKMLELNPRLFATARDVYLQTLTNGDNYSASFMLQLDMPVPRPVRNGKYAIMHWLATHDESPTNELFNFDEAYATKGCCVNMSEQEHIYLEPGAAFMLVCHLAIEGKDFWDCTRKMKEIRKRILKKPSSFPNRTLLEVLPSSPEL